MAYSIDLSGRVAFVTGASSGLGAQFARTAPVPVPTPVPTLSQWDTVLLALCLSIFGLQRLSIKR